MRTQTPHPGGPVTGEDEGRHCTHAVGSRLPETDQSGEESEVAGASVAGGGHGYADDIQRAEHRAHHLYKHAARETKVSNGMIVTARAESQMLRQRM